MNPNDYYEFEGFRFFPQQQRLIRISDNASFSLTPKQSGLLTMLAKKPGEIVTYKMMKTEIWGGTEADIDRNIKEVMYTLRKILDKPAANRIENITGKGYRLVSEVFFSREADASTDSFISSTTVSPSSESEKSKEIEEDQDVRVFDIDRRAFPTTNQLFGGYLWHVIASSTIYALLYPVALFIEVAYQFDRFRNSVWRLTPLVFFWMFTSSIIGLASDAKYTLRGKTMGMQISLLTFIVAALILYFSLGLFLPSVPITEAQFQTYTAYGAYLKDISYFITLAVVFLILPFHFVISLQRESQVGNYRLNRALLTGKRQSVAPKGAVYLKVWWLAILLFILAIASLILTAHLFENLKPNINMNLFMHLVQWRLLLYFVLGVECVIWYYKSLNEIKRESLKTIRA